MVASLKFFIALIFHIYLFNKTKNLNLGFRIGNFRHSGPLDIYYGCIFANSNFK